MIWCGVEWCGVVWSGVVWCGLVWSGVVWCGVVLSGVKLCCVVCCSVVCDFIKFSRLYSPYIFMEGDEALIIHMTVPSEATVALVLATCGHQGARLPWREAGPGRWTGGGGRGGIAAWLLYRWTEMLKPLVLSSKCTLTCT